MQLVVYSCIVGNIDPLTWLGNSSARPDPRVKLILFTDRQPPEPLAGEGGWELRPLQWRHQLSERRTARYHKVLSHIVLPEASQTVWIDGSMRLRPGVDLWAFAQQQLSQHSLAAFRHPQRQCLYQEAAAVIRLKKDDRRVVLAQQARYRALDYPPYAGLAETGCLVRRHNEEIKEFNRQWWAEIERGSLRDQLSFPFVTRQLGLIWAEIPGRGIQSEYFEHLKHRKR